MSRPSDPQGQLNDGGGANGSFSDGDPREGSREIHDGIIVSEAMDWCRKDGAIVPYRLWAKQIQAADLANSVRQTDDRSHVKESIVLVSHGDAPGAFGIHSGTHNAECTPMTWSATVRAEGRNMVRHDDLWWMNHKNTYGRLTYVKDTSGYPTPDPQLVKAKMQVAFLKDDKVQSDAPDPDARAPQPESQPGNGSNTRDQLGNAATKRLLLGTGAAGILAGGILVMTTSSTNQPSTVRITRSKRDEDCCIAPYWYNAPYNRYTEIGQNGCRKCKKEPTAAHHGMVDYPFRTGTATASKLRAPGAPSYLAALTICVPTGDPDDPNATDEHGDLHRNFEASMKSPNNNGIVTFGQVKANSFQEIDRLPNDTLSPDCKALYKQELSQQYKLLDEEQLRGRQSPSPESDPDPTTFNTLQQAWRPH